MISSYDINRQVSTVRDGRGALISYLYDEADQQVNMIDAAGNVMTTTYTLDGRR